MPALPSRCSSPQRTGHKQAWLAPLLAAALLLTGQSGARGAGGNALYARAVEADDRVSYSGTLTSVVYEGDHAASAVTRIEHKAPQFWRIWYMAPADAYGRMIVSDESRTYQYEPSRSLVFTHDWNQSAPAVATPVDVTRVEANYSVEVGPGASVAGRKATSLSLVSKHTGSLVQRIWVDDQTKLILRRESYTADGSVAAKSSFDSIRIGVDLPQDLFSLAVPNSMKLIAAPSFGKSTTDTAELVRSIDFKFAAPKYLPDGFTLERGSVEAHDGVNTVEFVYGDGLRTFSLFENATGRLPRFDRAAPERIEVGDADGESADVAGQTLVSWNSGGLNCTIVGDLPSKEIAKIGASIHP